jgi:predicted PurR-regulated permease PerM
VTVKAIDERRPKPPAPGADVPVTAPPQEAATPAPEPAVGMPVDIRSAALTVLAVLALIAMLQYAQAMIIPIVLALLISYALEPVVARLALAHVPRPLGAAIVVLLVVGVTCSLLYSLRTEANQIIEQLPQAARHVRQTLENDRPKSAGAIEKVQKAANELQKAADAAAPAPPPQGVTRVQIEEPPFAVGDYLVWGSMSIATAVGQAVLILFLVYFLLASGDLYKRKMVKIVGPSLSKKKITVQILADIDRQIEWFLLVQALTSAVVALATWIAFRAIGFQQAAVWGLLAGVFNSIPYFGPVLVTGGIAVVGYVQFDSLRMALLAAGLALAITSLEGFLLTPWLTSRATRMNAVAIFVGLLFWGWVWNVWGMLLAVPMLTVLKTVSDHVEDFKGVGELLGD